MSDGGELLKQIRRNHAALDACAGHTFTPETEILFSWFKCSSCGGRVSGEAARWYARGRAHGKP